MNLHFERIDFVLGGLTVLEVGEAWNKFYEFWQLEESVLARTCLCLIWNRRLAQEEGLDQLFLVNTDQTASQSDKDLVYRWDFCLKNWNQVLSWRIWDRYFSK